MPRVLLERRHGAGRALRGEGAGGGGGAEERPGLAAVDPLERPGADRPIAREQVGGLAAPGGAYSPSWIVRIISCITTR
jgi:hypothetical protein